MKVKDTNSYHSLKKFSHETCDFCDKEFDNRYESIIHNASHIIIPLLKGSIFSCNLCNTYYTSSEDLEQHCASKHPIKTIHTKQIQAINEKHDLSEDLQHHSASKHPLKNTHTKQIQATNEKHNLINEKHYNNEKLHLNHDIKADIEPIRNRIKFEDDFSIHNGLINDLVTECKVNVQLFTLNNCNVLKNDTLDLLNVTPVMVKEAPKYESISYSCLMKPGIYNCRHCSKSYPNRFSLVKHEKHHIRLRNGRPLLCTLCDRFIAGNYRNLHSHIQKQHPGAEKKECVTHICKRCGLRFKRYKRHVKNYHIHDCLPCGMEFNTAYDYQEHVRKCNISIERAKLIKVCNICYSFLKNKINLSYLHMGVMGNEMGVRYACEYCGVKQFELNLVKRIQKSRSYCNYKHKRVTNEDRLKNIQQRLKKLNLLNRFYCVVLFQK